MGTVSLLVLPVLLQQNVLATICCSSSNVFTSTCCIAQNLLLHGTVARTSLGLEVTQLKKM